MAGFTTDARGQDTMYADNVDFSGAANPLGQFNANGQILIGSTATPNIRIGTLTAGSGVSILNGSGSITIGLASSGVVTSITGGSNINITGTANVPIVNLNTQILEPSGTVGAPSYSFSADPTTGYYYSASGPDLALSVAGANVMTIGSFGAVINPGTIFNQEVWIQGGIQVNYTNPGSYPYNVISGGDYYIGVNSSLARTINLPNTPKTNEVFVVKDSTGSAGTNNITITTPGGTVTFDGSTSFIIDSNYGSAQFIYNASGNYEVF